MKTTLPSELFLDAIRQAADARYVLVVFTGGEPTLEWSLLVQGIALAKSHGMGTRLVTNAWWANSAQTAEELVAELVSAGLDELNVSTGDQHARFVPVENVIWAARAGASAGVPVAIMIELVQERMISRATVEAHPEFQALTCEFPRALLRVLESPWMPLSPTKTGDNAEGTAIDHRNIAGRSGCDSVLSTTTVQADGTIGACCGIGLTLIPELQLGNIASVKLAEADADAGDDFLKRWIRTEGPERILEWAAQYDHSIEWEGLYAHRCQACIRLYRDPAIGKVIRDHHQEKVPDVVLGEWLLHEYQGATQASPASAVHVSDLGGEADSITEIQL